MVEWIAKLNIPEGWFYGIIGAIITGIIIGLINHILTSRRKRRNDFINAASKFRAIIDPERVKNLREYNLLNALNYGLVPGKEEKFEGEFFKHKRAVHEYRIYLPLLERFRLNRAWKEYHGGDEENPDLMQYCNRDDGPELLKKRLKKLRKVGNKK